MDPADSDIVFQSYGRCCNNEQFFVDFYDFFMSSSEEVRAMFTETDMKQQRHLLRNGIMQLVLHARGLPDTKLRALGESHSRRGYNVRPDFYHLWLEALMKTLRRHDPEFSDTVESAWRRAIQPGIEIIRGAY
ncbi:globin [Microbulbifer thermotolerans]|uniref:Globin n=1 Tax=Microbulbifer thermotolerans TaxID=252514 RepID=A0A143HPG0_MICTH|nr:globin [Microbulbifer thermotolerans]AMX03624.1 globin [Microbulbifer thermotolerans]MCX2781011.1 globin [Microbulbifer thermotolerans]MCX2782114.1 globin [Microbulbifer thermotolerans]MCX2796083.1 globin [Microbulbifer thermotolerans]MCX2801225.1 globin [Microbulbifer thermotolerans]